MYHMIEILHKLNSRLSFLMKIENYKKIKKSLYYHFLTFIYGV